MLPNVSCCASPFLGLLNVLRLTLNLDRIPKRWLRHWPLSTMGSSAVLSTAHNSCNALFSSLFPLLPPIHFRFCSQGCDSMRMHGLFWTSTGCLPDHRTPSILGPLGGPASVFSFVVTVLFHHPYYSLMVRLRSVLYKFSVNSAGHLRRPIVPN